MALNLKNNRNGLDFLQKITIGYGKLKPYISLVLVSFAVLHIYHLIKYEHEKAIPIRDQWIEFVKKPPCPTDIDSHWLGVLLYVRCYPLDFPTRISKMQEERKN